MFSKLTRPSTRRNGERGQILVLFTIAIIVIFGFTALVVDLGMLRNDRQRLVNALDAGALAGAFYLPIDLEESGAANMVEATNRIEDLIEDTVAASFPGLTAPDDYTIEYRCAIGRNPPGHPGPGAAGAPAFEKDIPLVCDPRNTIGSNPATWTVDVGPNSTWVPSGSAVFHSTCNPRAGDVCNVVALRGDYSTAFSFARILGVNEGSSAASGNTDAQGNLVSAACSAPTCGVRKDPVPVDVVLILDRTLSMVQSGDQEELREAAEAVLGAYDPALVRVALGFLGPSRTATSCGNGANGLIVLPPQPPVTTQVPVLVADSGNPVAAANRGSGSNQFRSVRINRAGSSNQTGNLLIATIAINGNSNVTTPLPTGWQALRTVTQGSELRLSTFYKIGTNNEPDNYDFRVGSGVTAIGSLLRFSGVDTSTAALNSLGSSSNNSSGSTNSGTGTSAVATGVTPTTEDNMLVGVWALDRNGSFTPPNPSGTANDMVEEFDGDANDSGVTLMAATDPHETATATSNRTATASGSGSGARWASQLLVLRPTPVVQPPPVPVGNRYGEAIPSAPAGDDQDAGKWIPVTFSDDFKYPEDHAQAGQPNPASNLVRAVQCFDFSQSANNGFSGTNLTTPIRAASYYLQKYGNPDAKWGIIFETDGQPQLPIDDHVDLLGSAINTANFTCGAANTAATAAKAVTNPNTGEPIEIYTIGYNFNNPPNCPDGSGTFRNRTPAFLLSEMGSSPEIDTGNCSSAFRATENDDDGHFFCAGQGVNPADVFAEVAGALIDYPPGLMQYYPIPEVTAVGSGAPGTTVTITGRNFTDTNRVTFGTTSATVLNVTGTSIQVRVPGGSGTTNVRVTTPYGTSAITAGSSFTYP